MRLGDSHHLRCPRVRVHQIRYSRGSSSEIENLCLPEVSTGILSKSFLPLVLRRDNRESALQCSSGEELHVAMETTIAKSVDGDRIRRAITRISGSDIQISFEEEDSIPRMKSGKTMSTVSRIDPPANANRHTGNTVN